MVCTGLCTKAFSLNQQDLKVHKRQDGAEKEGEG